MNTGEVISYQELIPRFKEVVLQTIAPGTTVAVVSKGDSELIALDSINAWHFPRREDGVYAGFYPPDSAAAIAHLENLRTKGVEHLIFPQPSLWWLDHYKEFRQHLDQEYQLIRSDDKTAHIYLLTPARKSHKPGKKQSETSRHVVKTPAAPDLFNTSAETSNKLKALDERVRNDLLRLFDLNYYSEQAGVFSSLEAAVVDYLEFGHQKGYSPSRLFDHEYYVSRYLNRDQSSCNPLIHFLTHSVHDLSNPNPFFDTEFYYDQKPAVRRHRINALVHYLARLDQHGTNRPNPLFSDAYYLEANPDVRRAGLNPLSHFISQGCLEGRFGSHIHKQLFSSLVGASKQHLFRGNWRIGNVLLFSEGETSADTLKTLKLAAVLEQDYHLRSMIILSHRTGLPPEIELDEEKIAVLGDYKMVCQVFRPSALRLLVRSLRRTNPLFAATSYPAIIRELRTENIPCLHLVSNGVGEHSKADFQWADQSNVRMVFENSSDFHRVAKLMGHYPTKVALRPYQERNAAGYVKSLMTLARHDFQLPQDICQTERAREATDTRKVFIPCCDWEVSGVNSAIEAVGKELISRGWNVEILFTREIAGKLQNPEASIHLPEIPYCFIETKMPGMEGIWEALIAHLETQSPCLMLMGYDFAANSIAPALTEKVGVIAWAQSDDKDYYEQAYRLGRYCNAIVCVSEHIKQGIIELNPALGVNSHVIHNSSVWESQITAGKHRRAKRMRLIYTGRLVQYQKRILDVIHIAEALDRLGVPYEINLIGEFSRREVTESLFKTRAKTHLQNGRIKLHSRMKRERILDELSQNDFFLLLSDFEGLPLSLIEAMAKGCVPVVADMRSGIPEAVTHKKNGLILTGRNYDNWARELVEIWRNPKTLTRLSRQAQQTVLEQFTMEHIGEQFDKLFTRVATEICRGDFRRPDSLNWGEKRSPSGDILPPPSLIRLRKIPELQNPISNHAIV